jgi:hypothetical protein
MGAFVVAPYKNLTLCTQCTWCKKAKNNLNFFTIFFLMLLYSTPHDATLSYLKLLDAKRLYMPTLHNNTHHYTMQLY